MQKEKLHVRNDILLSVYLRFLSEESSQHATSLSSYDHIYASCKQGHADESQ